MSLFKFLKKEDESDSPEKPRTKRVVHYSKFVKQPPQPTESESDSGWGSQTDDAFPAENNHGEEESTEANLPARKFKTIMDAVKKAGPAMLPRKYRVRTAMWDLSSGISLLVNAVLLGLVLLMAFRINTLEKTINGLLGGLYDNFVRMDKSYISTTILVEDMPIPLDFTLPVVQDQTDVTLTRDVTIRNAHVVIDTGQLSINAPATVTLPAGTTLPVSLRMDVPVQTTVLVDLQVPINIELASANPSDPGISNLHTAFLGLQDTIGPLYCLLQPAAVDYLSQPLCDGEGMYIHRTPPTP
jgi:hypothetical protein